MVIKKNIYRSINKLGHVEVVENQNNSLSVLSSSSIKPPSKQQPNRKSNKLKVRVSKLKVHGMCKVLNGEAIGCLADSLNMDMENCWVFN